MNNFSDRTKPIEFILKYISIKEPCSVVAMDAMGLNWIYRDFANDENLGVLPSYKRIVYQAANLDELNEILTEVEKQKTLLILRISINQDVSAFFEKLDQIRNKKYEDFVPVVITNIQASFQGIVNGLKIVTKNVYVRSLLVEEDYKEVIDRLQEKYGIELNQDIYKKIYKLSGGHIGLIKALFTYYFETKQLGNNLELIKISSINTKLKLLFEDLNEQIWNEVFFNSVKNTNVKNFLENIGYTKNGHISIPLFQTYLEQYFDLAFDSSQFNFTDTEKKVFIALYRNPNKILTYDDLAVVMWGDKWNEKFSDWAISQIIKRVRDKLLLNKAKFEIKTDRKKGYVLKHISND